MAIQFSCQCGKVLKAAEEHAGKRAKCGGCGQTVHIPHPKQHPVKAATPIPVAQPVVKTPIAKPVAQPVARPAKMTTPVAKPKEPDFFDFDDLASSAAASDTTIGFNSLTSISQDKPAAQPPAGRLCPSCHKPMSDIAVLCVNCGYNVQSGKKMSTFSYTPSTYDEAPKKRKQSFMSRFVSSRLQSGKFMTGIAMMIGAAVWFFAGIFLLNRIYFYPPIMFVIGAFSFISGLVDGGD
jgi:DNA-directed RNA polymerase subunit M/transcription elongation factor TFIIS